MSRVLERRTIPSPLKIREEGDKPRILEGYAATFDSPSQDLGGYVEVLKAGCFKKTLETGDQRAFYNHCYDKLLGRTKSGTLRLWEDDKGLAFEIDVPDTVVGDEVYKLTERGDLDGMSFGFYALVDEWSDDGKVNTIIEAELIEISSVVFPAYLNGPIVTARSAEFFKTSPERIARRPKPKMSRLERARLIIRADSDD